MARLGAGRRRGDAQHHLGLQPPPAGRQATAARPKRAKPRRVWKGRKTEKVKGLRHEGDLKRPVLKRFKGEKLLEMDLR